MSAAPVADYAIAGDRRGLRHRALDAVGDGSERRVVARPTVRHVCERSRRPARFVI
jgi:hypothetical protein